MAGTHVLLRALAGIGAVLGLVLSATSCSPAAEPAIDQSWSTHIEGSAYVKAADETRAYFRSTNRLTTVAIETGDLLWSRPLVPDDVWPVGESVIVSAAAQGGDEFLFELDAATGTEIARGYFESRSIMDVKSNDEMLVVVQDDSVHDQSFAYVASMKGEVHGGPWVAPPGCSISDGAITTAHRLVIVHRCESESLVLAGPIDATALGEVAFEESSVHFDSVDTVGDMITLNDGSEMTTTVLSADLEELYNGIAIVDRWLSNDSRVVLNSFRGENWVVGEDGTQGRYPLATLSTPPVSGVFTRLTLTGADGAEIAGVTSPANSQYTPLSTHGGILVADAGVATTVTRVEFDASGIVDAGPALRIAADLPIAGEAGQILNASIAEISPDQLAITVAEPYGAIMGVYHLTAFSSEELAAEARAFVLSPSEAGISRGFYSPGADVKREVESDSARPVLVVGRCVLLGAEDERPSGERLARALAAALKTECD